MTAPIPLVASLSDDRLTNLVELVEELAAYAFTVGRPYLRQIEVVPDEAFSARINAIMAQDQHGGRVYTAPTHGGGAVTVPAETGRALVCTIILAERQVLPYPARDARLVSTLLEELLHVDLYVQHFQRRGYVQPTDEHVPVHLVDLTIIASKLMDEYLVNRRKTVILASYPLADIDGQRQPFVVETPTGQLESALDQSLVWLRQIVSRHMDGVVGEETWNEMLQWLFRGPFEALAYAAGKRASWEAPYPIEHEAAQSRFFREHVQGSWQAVAAQFERAHASTLAKFDDAARQIVNEFRAFLRHIGIDLHDDGRFFFTPDLYRWV